MSAQRKEALLCFPDGTFKARYHCANSLKSIVHINGQSPHAKDSFLHSDEVCHLTSSTASQFPYSTNLILHPDQSVSSSTSQPSQPPRTNNSNPQFSAIFFNVRQPHILQFTNPLRKGLLSYAFPITIWRLMTA